MIIIPIFIKLCEIVRGIGQMAGRSPPSLPVMPNRLGSSGHLDPGMICCGSGAQERNVSTVCPSPLSPSSLNQQELKRGDEQQEHSAPRLWSYVKPRTLGQTLCQSSHAAQPKRNITATPPCPLDPPLLTHTSHSK